MMIKSIYEYDTGDGIIWSPNGCGIEHHKKDCPQLSELEVRCERMSDSDFLRLSKALSGERLIYTTQTKTPAMTG